MSRALWILVIAVSAAAADEVRWVGSYDEGLSAARASGKPLLIHFFAEG